MATQTIVRSRLFLLLAAISLVATLSWQGSARENGEQKRADGAKVFQKACVRCHTAPDPRDRSPQSWQTILMHMRVRAGLTASEAEAVLAFLKEQAQAPLPRQNQQGAAESIDASLQSRQTSEPAAASSTGDSVAAGRQFYEQLKCPSCHAIGGKGGQVGPPHDDVGQRLTRDQLRAKVKAGGKVMPPLPSGITEEQLNQLLDYLQTLKGH